MKADYEIIKIKWVDFVPFFVGTYTMVKRGWEMGECGLYSINALRSALVIHLNIIISTLLILWTANLLGLK